MKERTIARVFAENVAYYRRKQGHSQYDLAMISGISRTMTSHYEREGAMPPADRLQVLADALGVLVLYSQNISPCGNYGVNARDSHYGHFMLLIQGVPQFC